MPHMCSYSFMPLTRPMTHDNLCNINAIQNLQFLKCTSRRSDRAHLWYGSWMYNFGFLGFIIQIWSKQLLFIEYLIYLGRFGWSIIKHGCTCHPNDNKLMGKCSYMMKPPIDVVNDFHRCSSMLLNTKLACLPLIRVGIHKFRLPIWDVFDLWSVCKKREGELAS